MLIFDKLSNNENLSVALGFFDGVHKAHKLILTTAVNLAKENGLKSAVITFKKSPGGYFDDKKNINIQTLEDRLDYISKTGTDYAYVLDFSEFKHLTAQQYLNDVLIKNFNPKFIVTGFNHTFGLNKIGNSNFLRQNEGTYKYIEINKLRLNNALVSSTNIKKFIEKGYIKEANELLGYKFNVKGKVVHGMKLAGKLGYKTANVEWNNTIVKPPYGVYFAFTEHKGKVYPSVANFGVKPTVKDFQSPILEVHILNFDNDIYDDEIRVFFDTPIRAERKFNGLDELKTQISNDVSICSDFALKNQTQ